MKILVVDDSNTARYVTIKILRDRGGYKELAAAKSAEDALLRIATEKFDLILLDWNMGGMSGFEFLKRFRADPKNSATSVIMITTVNEKTNVISALKVGLQGYFFKPVSAEALVSKIKEIEAKAGSNSPVSSPTSTETCDG